MLYRTKENFTKEKRKKRKKREIRKKKGVTVICNSFKNYFLFLVFVGGTLYSILKQENLSNSLSSRQSK